MDHMHIFKSYLRRLAALVLFSGLVSAKPHMHKWPSQMVTLGNWQEFPHLGDPRDLLRNARSQSSVIPVYNLTSGALEFKVCLQCSWTSSNKMHPYYLSHSISALLTAVMSCGCQDFFKANVFFCKMMKDKENISKILFSANILSCDILAHGSDI